MEPKFFDLYMQGLVSAGVMDDYIDQWHDMTQNISISLHEFLGLTWDEYGELLVDSSALDRIAERRRGTYSSALTSYPIKRGLTDGI